MEFKSKTAQVPPLDTSVNSPSTDLREGKIERLSKENQLIEHIYYNKTNT